MNVNFSEMDLVFSVFFLPDRNLSLNSCEKNRYYIVYHLLDDLMLLFTGKMSNLYLYWFLCHFLIDLCNPISGHDIQYFASTFVLKSPPIANLHTVRQTVKELLFLNYNV